VDFIFQGFQSSLPAWVYILIFIGTCLLSWWSYNSIEGIKKGYLYLLTTLRALVFFVLLLLLINPYVKTEKPFYEPANVTVLLDNSASTTVQKSDYKGIDSYQDVLNKLNFEDSSTVNFNFYTIGDQVTSQTPEHLDFKADQTDLSKAIETIKGNEKESNAAVIISDGIFTKGVNPIYESKNISIPIFTIGLGDTTFQKDAIASSVTTNATGYLDSKQPVTATIKANGFKGQTIPVELTKGDEIIDSKTVTPPIMNSSQQITFELPLDNEGLQQYEIRIPGLTGEWSTANNVQRFSVDVKDAKQQILSLAFEVHPDVRYIRSLLLQDKNTQLSNRTWLRGNKFIEGSFSFDPDTLDLAIIHGFPESGLPGSLRQKLKVLADKVPLLVAATPLFNPQRFGQQITSLPISITGPWDYRSVAITPHSDAANHPIMELPVVTYNQLPRVQAPVDNMQEAPGAKKLISNSFRGEDTQSPLLAVQELGNKRHALVTGFNWFRLSHDTNPDVRKFSDQLWLNIISWTAADPENELLDVRPAQKSFSGTESVIIDAHLNNERGEIEPNANINISISSDSLDNRFYSMENKGSGHYQLDLGTLPEGMYSFEATAKKEGRTIDIRKGEFAVAHSNNEFLDITRNDNLLGQLAQSTGGEYVPFDSVSNFWDKLARQGLLEQQKEVQTTFFYPYQYIAWFIVVLILLSAEWILRKYLSLP